MVEQRGSMLGWATKRGFGTVGEDVFSTVWEELAKEIDRGFTWWECPQGTCDKGIAGRAWKRYESRHLDHVRREPVESLDELLDAGALPGSTREGEVADPELQVVLAEQRGDVRRALNRLPYLWRTALFLYYFVGLTWPEVAEELGVSHASARQIASRARRQLRRELVLDPDGDAAEICHTS